jgi:hypothetical protein
VDQYPDCPRTTDPVLSCDPTLQDYLASEPISGGLNPCVDVTFAEGVGVGKPVTVSMEMPFNLVPILGIGELTLRADATMRQEWTASQYSTAANTC